MLSGIEPLHWRMYQTSITLNAVPTRSLLMTIVLLTEIVITVFILTSILRKHDFEELTTVARLLSGVVGSFSNRSNYGNSIPIILACWRRVRAGLLYTNNVCDRCTHRISSAWASPGTWFTQLTKSLSWENNHREITFHLELSPFGGRLPSQMAEGSSFLHITPRLMSLKTLL